MKSTLTRLLAFVTVLLLVFSLCACGSTEKETGGNAPAEGKTAGTTEAGNSGDAAEEDAYHVIRIGDADGDPTGSYDTSSPSGSVQYAPGLDRLCFDSLFYFDGNDELQTRIVEEYHYEDDTTLVLKIRDDIYFSDGTQLDGWDVLYSAQRYVDNGHTSMTYYVCYDFENSTVSDDGLTITLKYLYPVGPGIYWLTWPIQSKDFCEEHDPTDPIWMTSEVPHSGPYDMTECTLYSSIKYEKRDDYWNSANYDPEPDEIIVNYYTDATAMFIDFESGNLDICLGLNTTDYDMAASGAVENCEAVLIPGNDVLQLIMSDDNEALLDIRVREAICHAIDIQSTAIGAFGSLGDPATSSLSKTCRYYVEQEPYTYDPELALQLMEEAGYGLDNPLNLKFVTTNGDLQPETAEIVQAYLSKIGINFTLDVEEINTMLASYFEVGGTDFSWFKITGANITRDPKQIYTVFTDAGIFQQIVRQSDPDLQALIVKGENTVDDAERAEIYKEIQAYFHDNYITCPITEIYYKACFNTETVKNIHYISTVNTDFANIELAD